MPETDVYALTLGDVPMVMSIPHLGEAIPAALSDGMRPSALDVPDTDWDLDRLYDFAAGLGVTVLRAGYSRYVIDLNRSPIGAPLYPDASNTELVPTTSFADEPLYEAGALPGEEEIERRKQRYWEPYHRVLAETMDDFKRRFGVAVLFDSHSIRAHVPRFFSGRLPDFNLGTGDGMSCDPDLTTALAGALGGDKRYSLAVDGRFKGGYITRHYGRPGAGQHAFQLEVVQATYGDEGPPFVFREDLAEQVRPTLRRMVQTARDWALARASSASR